VTTRFRRKNDCLSHQWASLIDPITTNDVNPIFCAGIDSDSPTMRADPGSRPATEFTKACLSDSMYCPLGPGSDEEVREGTPNIGAYHCPNPMDYVIQGTTHGGWDRKKAGFASASFDPPNSFVSLSSGVGRRSLIRRFTSPLGHEKMTTT